jgi:hypothetical protein
MMQVRVEACGDRATQHSAAERSTLAYAYAVLLYNAMLYGLRSAIVSLISPSHHLSLTLPLTHVLALTA